MKTANFKMAFMTGLMGLAYSSRVITDEHNKVKEEEQSIAIEEVPQVGEITAIIDEPKTNLL